MKLGNLSKNFFISVLFLTQISLLYADDKIQSVPLINLEELSPTFEEDKTELEKIDENNTNINATENITNDEKLNSN